MSAESVKAHSLPASSNPQARVQYLGFRDEEDHREYRLAVTVPEGTVECRFRIAISAFGPEGVRLQDGPDVCYQELLRALDAGETPTPDVVTLGEAELSGYLVAHTRPTKPRARTTPPAWKSSAPKREFARPAAPLAPVPAPKDTPGAFAEGQRVSHAVFGVGVVVSSSRSQTVVCFDEGGHKAFVTTMVELDVLSPAHTWETMPRGKNRPRKIAAAGD